MSVIASLAELPFDELDPWVLLGLDPTHPEPNPDHEAVGYCRLDRVWLEGPESARVAVDNVLILGLHSREDPAPFPDDVEIEFWLVDEAGEDYAAVTRVSRFLDIRLAALLGDSGAVVLALCNPRRGRLARPDGLGTRQFWFAEGDVTAWMQRRPGSQLWTPKTVEISLHAAHWHQC